MRTIIKNAALILPDRILTKGFIVYSDGIITQIGEGNFEAYKESDNVIDAKGNYVSAGFIDMHTHGAGGHDFMDNTVEAYLGAAATHARYGTTSLVPTTLTSTTEELLHTFSVYKQANGQNDNGAAFLGLHLEGPYFAYSQRGAQDPKYLRNPEPEEYNRILAESNGNIIRWSMAPELDGALALGDLLKSKGILASLGHTDALYDEVVEAYKHGFTHVTHLYSCMSTVTRRNAYRYAGAIEAAYMIDDMSVEIIADGIHLPKALLQYVCKFKATDKIVLCTDSMRAAGMPDGEYILGSKEKGQKVIVEDGVAKLPDRSAFAGSVATADRLVRTMVEIAEVPLHDAVKMITQNAAEVLGVSKAKGSLEVGKDADIVIFDSKISVQTTIVKGKIIYTQN
ncbi:N-acetylglucosamine-6-phosphate deacetylase [Prevotella sp. 10(H)]|uniref:N-acetylglucosamine-6-phosphate deacetylase n=1 Tax=Prevotella sp. 10(H) TaxID=1158294 RepID=UPI0004A6F26B|nr:N-acetylglucosamine-6-phosphate deacetylase [Prevotella sp. 10(H)]